MVIKHDDLPMISGTASTSSAPAKRIGVKKIKESNTVLLVEESLLNEEWIAALRTQFLTIDESMPTKPSIESNSSNEDATSSGSSLQMIVDERRLRYKSLTTPLAGLIQWFKIPSFSDHKAWFYSDHLPHLYNMHVLLGNSVEFCKHALQAVDGVSFTEVDTWIERLIAKTRQHCFQSNEGEAPRIVLLFSDLDKQITKEQKKLSKKADCSTVASECIDGACIHLLLEFGIEIVRCKGITEVSEYLHTLTRSLESQLERPLTAFNCVNKASRLKAGDELSGPLKEKFSMNQTWMAMMQMLPHMSKDRAMAAASFAQFSCVKRVYDAMNDSKVPKNERKLLMQSSFGGKRDRDGNVIAKNPKLARQMYRLMTEHDPNKNVGNESDEDSRT